MVIQGAEDGTEPGAAGTGKTGEVRREVRRKPQDEPASAEQAEKDACVYNAESGVGVGDLVTRCIKGSPGGNTSLQLVNSRKEVN